MSTVKPFIIPVETQVREFDAKLLLACVAAERGIPAYIGFQNRIRDRINTLPAGIYLAKSLSLRKTRIMRILDRLGHDIYAWDEEGLVHQPPYVYYDRRMSKQSLTFLSGLFAWGQDYKEMVENSPDYDGTPIFSTGNPRVDLLHPKARSFFDNEVAAIRNRFGQFVLLNSSFGTSNTAAINPADKPPNAAAMRKSDIFWKAQAVFRQELFSLYQKMCLKLAENFPNRVFIVRPHPAENLENWKELVAPYSNLKIENKGSVAPWLLACDMMIHNGCMTAVEGALLGTTVLAYQPLSSDEFDRHLPNSISIKCETLEEVFAAINGQFPTDDTSEDNVFLNHILDHFLVLDDERLSADRIVDVIQKERPVPKTTATRSIGTRSAAWIEAELRAISKKIRSYRHNDIYATWHQRQQFPSMSVEQVTDKITRFSRSFDRFSNVKAKVVQDDIFLIKSP